MAFDMHSSIVLKSYPLSQKHYQAPLPPVNPVVAAARQAAQGRTFLQRMNAVHSMGAARRASLNSNSRLGPMYTSCAKASYGSVPRSKSAGNAAAGGGDGSMAQADRDLAWKHGRSTKFTTTFQEPGGSFMMFNDSSLGSLQRQELLRAQEEERKVKMLQERQQRIQDMIREKESKLRARRDVRENRRREAAQRHDAAVNIQRTFKGYYTRKQINAYKQHRLHYSAYRIQHCYRNHAERRSAVEEVARRREVRRVDNAARSITRGIRNYTGRKQAGPIVEAKRAQRQAEWEAELAAINNDAATRIQSLQRGKRDRARVAEMRAAKRRQAILEMQEEKLEEKGRDKPQVSSEIGKPFGLTGVPASPSPAPMA